MTPPAFDLARFRAGDERLVTELVASHSPLLVPTLRRYAESEADVGDLLQEVWLRAYVRRATFDGRGSFAGWLLTIARNVGLDAVRKRARQPSTADPRDVADPQSETSGASHAPAFENAVRDAILSLPERQREVVMLRLLEGLSTAETARRLGCAEGTIKATLHRAVGKLREILEEAKR